MVQCLAELLRHSHCYRCIYIHQGSQCDTSVGIEQMQEGMPAKWNCKQRLQITVTFALVPRIQARVKYTLQKSLGQHSVASATESTRGGWPWLVPPTCCLFHAGPESPCTAVLRTLQIRSGQAFRGLTSKSRPRLLHLDVRRSNHR
jgi:hypothetical protein